MAEIEDIALIRNLFDSFGGIHKHSANGVFFHQLNHIQALKKFSEAHVIIT